MKINKFIVISFLLCILTGCNQLATISPTQGLTVSNFVISTITPIKTPLKTATTLPSDSSFLPTSDLNSSPTPMREMAHWLIGDRRLDVDTVYVLGDDLKIIYSFSDILVDAFLDTNTCLILEINNHYEKQSGVVNSIGFDIEWQNLAGNHIETKLVKFPHDPYNTYQIRVSPTMQWIAYKQALNWKKLYSISDSQTQDVFILPMSFDNEVEAVQITQNSGAWIASILWSPNGRYLAFTDFDSSGNQQLYIYEPETGIKKQLTDQQNKELETFIFDFKWLNNSSQIVFISGLAINTENQFLGTTNTLGVVNIESGIINWVYPETEGLNLEINGIGEAGLLVITENDKSIVWYETQFFQVVHRYNLDDRKIVILVDGKGETVITSGYPTMEIYNINVGKFEDTKFGKDLGLFHIVNTIDNNNYFNCLVP